MTNVEVNEYGTNRAIKSHILPDDEMRKLGFKESAKNALCPHDHWYLYTVFSDIDISFNLTIPKNGSDVRIDVLDECFCQPYDYQFILRTHPNHKIANLVRERVEEKVQHFQDVGVLSGHQYGEYI